jgi:hypothetical protein
MLLSSRAQWFLKEEWLLSQLQNSYPSEKPESLFCCLFYNTANNETIQFQMVGWKMNDEL